MGAGPSAKSVILETASGLSEEEYELQVSSVNQTIILRANHSAGMFYAVQSLRSILDGYNWTDIPSMEISDSPRYGWRGMHLDVARNFHSVEDVKKLMAVMAMYKMNKLHLHLSDDEGWRLEIPGLPELTQVCQSHIHNSTTTYSRFNNTLTCS